MSVVMVLTASTMRFFKSLLFHRRNEDFIFYIAESHMVWGLVWYFGPGIEMLVYRYLHDLSSIVDSGELHGANMEEFKYCLCYGWWL